MSDIETLKQLMAGVREQANKIDQELEAALQRREAIARIPIPKAELYTNLCYAIDEGAKDYEKQLSNEIIRLSRKRGADAYGVNKTPDVFRCIGAYGEIEINALHYFYGDAAKAKLKDFIFKGVDLPDGLADQQYLEQLDAADVEIDRIAKQRDVLLAELDLVGKAA
jgi:hypothetical protein